MSDFGDLVEPLQRVRAVPPSGRWRNRWRCIVDHRNPSSGATRFAGFDYESPKTHPTKEIAEARALAMMAEWRSPIGKRWEDFLFYLGAFPDGERP